MSKRYAVIYRTGGRERFAWHRTLPYATQEEADQALRETRQAGYHAFIADYDRSGAIGLPESWEYRSF